MPAGWQSSPANAWGLSDPLGSLVHAATGGGGALAVTQPNATWTDYVTTIAFEFDETPEGGIVARYVDSSNFYHLRLRANRRTLEIYRFGGAGNASLVGNSLPSADELLPETTYYMRFSIVGSALSGQLATDAAFTNIINEVSTTDSSITQGGVGLRNFASSTNTTYFQVDSFVTVVPEPAYAALLLGSGILVIIALKRRRLGAKQRQ